MASREVPILFKSKYECCGCTACYSICKINSVNAITMIEDEEGFLYPKIDESKCIKCHLCVKVCPLEKKE